MSLPHDLVEDLDEYTEEMNLNSRSKAVEILARKQLEADEADQEDEEDEEPPRPTASGRSASTVTILGVLALALGPTFLSTGYTALGAVVSAIGATYALLWATAYDLVLARKYDDVRAELGDVGGVVGFFRVMWAKWEGTHHVEDPDTPVERAARVDLFAPVLLAVVVLVSAPLWLALEVFGYAPEVIVGLLGVSGTLGYLGLIIGLFYTVGLLLGLSSIATIAIATTRGPETAPADEDAVEEG